MNNTTLDLTPFKSENFSKNFEHYHCVKQLFNVCALCGKPCRTWKASFLIDGDLSEAVLVLGDGKAIDSFMAGAPLGFFAVGSDCLRRLPAEAKAFLYTKEEQNDGKRV